jgi:serine phosphatase RsbU (regulator of sigma subunit)
MLFVSKPSHPRSARARLLLAVASTLLALAVASDSTAAGERSSTGASRVASGPAAPGAHRGNGRGAAGSEAPSPAPVRATAPAGAGGAATSAPERGTGPRASRAEGGEARSRRSTAGAAPLGAARTRRNAPLGREGAHHREGTQSTAARSSTRSARKASLESGSAPRPSAASGVSAASAASAPAAPAAPSAPTTSTPSASTTAVAPTTPTTPAAGAPVGRARTRASRGARPAGAARTHVAAGAAATASPSAGAAPAVPTPVHAAAQRAAQPRLRGASGSLSASPIVRTITRIVNVVPSPIRLVIGVLLALVLAAALRSRLTALRARRLDLQRKQLLDDVGLLQAALLPLPPARIGPVATSAAYRPADGPGAGGDFYDVFARSDGQIAVIVGDVAGHGRDALPQTALVRFTMRAYLEAGLSPRDAVQTAGAVLERQLAGTLATVIAATYDPRKRLLTYASAGHPPPIVIGESTIAPITAASSPPLGAGLRTGSRETIVSIPGPSRVCFYTDGVTDSRIGSAFYGGARLTHELTELERGETAAQLLDRVAAATDSRPDDMAACMLTIEDGEGEPSVLVEELELDREEATHERVERFLLECGVEPQGIATLINSARAAAGPVGTVLLEVSSADGSPKVALRSDNVALLQSRQARRQARVGASL